MKNVLRFELLHQAVGDQLVVVRRLQVFGKGLECHQETEEVFVLIKRLGFGQRALFALPLAQFDEGLRRNRAFEMQVQLSLRKRADEGGWHGSDCKVQCRDWRDG